MNTQFKTWILALIIIFHFSAKAQIPVNPHKAPLYWSVYENNIEKEKAGVNPNYITEEDWLANITWVDENLKDLGYNMICIDGWGDINEINENGYRLSHSVHWEHDFAWWSNYLQERGMTLGMYMNPLWIHVADDNMTTKIVGTDIPVSSLKNPSENTLFSWCQVDRPGAEEYVKGYIQHFADMGVKYLRVDFLSWYEDGYDRYIGTVGPTRPHEHYETALRWMREACDANDMFLSLVMPHLYNDAETEQQYGHMVRINEDTGDGEWYKFSDKDRGQNRNGWSKYANAFDGFTYWSKIAGRGKMILDGDFIRINTFSNDTERMSVISAHLMAGGPVTISDQRNTIGDNIWLYQNEEMLALNYDGFVGKPLSADPTNSQSQIWKGQMSNGDWIVGLFNREGSTLNRSFNFQSELGLTEGFVRDLWSHTDLGVLGSLSENIPSHGCRIFRVSAGIDKVFAPSFDIQGGTYSTTQTISLQSSTADAVIYYTTDKSEPSSTSMQYIAPIEVNSSQTIKAIAIKDGLEQSYVSTETYYIGETPTQGGMYLGGTFNDWNLPDNPMELVGDNQWSIITYITAGNHELKFANQLNWKGEDWGNNTGSSGEAQLTTGGGANISFSAAETGNYIITFNDYTLSYNIEKTFDYLQEQMYVAGSFNGWNLGENEMTLVADHLWKSDPIDFTAGGYELKFTNTTNWSGDDWGNASGLNGVAELTTGGSPNLSFQISTDGSYQLSFNDQTLEYSISGYYTGIESVKSSNSFVYPNPASDQLNINIGKATHAIVTIYNMSGNTLYYAETNSESIIIDLKSIEASGLQFIKIETGSYSEIHKIVVN